MASRTYGQFCGLARALELVGERWALLVVRDLILGPKRFTDLRRGLPRIPTNVLAARLKELEQAAIVQRKILPRPSSSVVYELTKYGQELRGIVLTLGAWGARSLGPPHPDDVVTPDSLMLALHAIFQAEAARGRKVTFELHVGEVVVHARVNDGALEVGEGAVTDADLVLEAGPVLKALLAREIGPQEALDSGSLRIVGNADLLTQFVEVFHVAPAPAADSK